MHLYKVLIIYSVQIQLGFEVKILSMTHNFAIRAVKPKSGVNISHSRRFILVTIVPKQVFQETPVLAA